MRLPTHTARSLTLLLLVAAGGCHRPRNAGDVPNSPQASLEASLLRQKHSNTRRTSDGGVLYTAELIPGNPEIIRVPYDLLKLECENHSGRFEQAAPPQRSAASFAGDANKVADPVAAMLADADKRGLFGQFRCEGAGDYWLAEIEPHALASDNHPRLMIYARASLAEEDDYEYDEEAPAGPGLPAIGDARQKLEQAPPPPPPPTAAGEPAPSEAPEPPSNAAPLDQQGPRPIAKRRAAAG